MITTSQLGCVPNTLLLKCWLLYVGRGLLRIPCITQWLDCWWRCYLWHFCYSVFTICCSSIPHGWQCLNLMNVSCFNGGSMYPVSHRASLPLPQQDIQLRSLSLWIGMKTTLASLLACQENCCVCNSQIVVTDGVTIRFVGGTHMWCNSYCCKLNACTVCYNRPHFDLHVHQWRELLVHAVSYLLAVTYSVNLLSMWWLS